MTQARKKEKRGEVEDERGRILSLSRLASSLRLFRSGTFPFFFVKAFPSGSHAGKHGVVHFRFIYRTHVYANGPPVMLTPELAPSQSRRPNFTLCRKKNVILQDFANDNW